MHSRLGLELITFFGQRHVSQKDGCSVGQNTGIGGMILVRETAGRDSNNLAPQSMM